MIRKPFEPYQFLFPIGLVHALVGTSVWILFAFGWMGYPGPRHVHQMMLGFLLTFAAGFLLTAIPRFTGSRPCSLIELSIATVFSLLSLIFVHPAFALAQLLLIVIFAIRRVVGGSSNPPPHFIFLPIGLGFGIVGSLIMILIEAKWMSTQYLFLAKLFLYYGMMLAFLLGVGAKLIAALLGWATLPNQQVKTVEKQSGFMNQMKIPFVQATLFVSGFIFESLGFVSVGRGFRAICVTWIAMMHWRIYKLPKTKGNFACWIFISAWVLVCSVWIHALIPQLEVHAAHLIFIGGFGLMTLMIATRVTLSHGGYSLEIETKLRRLHIVGAGTLLAMLTRFVAPWMNSYIHHLAYAAFLWIAAIIVWSVYFVPKMLRRDGGQNHEYHKLKPRETTQTK